MVHGLIVLAGEVVRDTIETLRDRQLVERCVVVLMASEVSVDRGGGGGIEG